MGPLSLRSRLTTPQVSDKYLRAFRGTSNHRETLLTSSAAFPRPAELSVVGSAPGLLVPLREIKMARKNIPNGAYKTIGAAKRACTCGDEFVIYHCEYGYGWAAIDSAVYVDIRTKGESDPGLPAKIVEVCVADPGGQF